MYIEYYGNDGSLRYLGDVNELYHYNHNHDALGRFAKSVGSVSAMPASTPRQYAKKANKLEKLSTKGRGKAMVKENTAGKMEAKRNKKGAKLAKAQAKKYREIASKAENAAKKTAAEAYTKKHYTVKEKVVRRNAKAKQDFWISMGIAASGYGAIPVIGYNAAVRYKDKRVYGGRYNGETPRNVYGKKYSVKQTRNGKRKSYTSANKIYDEYGQLVPAYTRSTKTGAVVDNRKKKKK